MQESSSCLDASGGARPMKKTISMSDERGTCPQCLACSFSQERQERRKGREEREKRARGERKGGRENTPIPTSCPFIH